MCLIGTSSCVRHSKANQSANSYNTAVSNTLRLHRKPVMFTWNLDFVLEERLNRQLNFNGQMLLSHSSDTVRHVHYCIRLLINVGGQSKDFEIL